MSRCSYIISVLGCVSRISEATLSVKIGLSRSIPASRPARPPAAAAESLGLSFTYFLLVGGDYSLCTRFCITLGDRPDSTFCAYPATTIWAALAETPPLEQALLSVDGHVARITLNRPDQRNPLSGQMLRDLASAFRWCRDEPEVRVVVVTGAGRVFCAGADLSSFDGDMTTLEKFRSRDLFVDLFILM